MNSSSRPPFIRLRDRSFLAVAAISTAYVLPVPDRAAWQVAISTTDTLGPFIYSEHGSEQLAEAALDKLVAQLCSVVA